MNDLSLDRSISEELRREREVIWQHDGIYANLSQMYNGDAVISNKGSPTHVHLIPGTLTVAEMRHGVVIEWNVEDDLPDWELTESVSFSQKNDENGDMVAFNTSSPVGSEKSRRRNNSVSARLDFSIELSEIRSFKLQQDACSSNRTGKRLPGVARGISSSKKGQPTIKFICKDGSSVVPLMFKNGGDTDFIAVLQRYVSLKRSVKENDLILVTDARADKLAESVNMLLDDTSTDFYSKLVSNPYATALTGLTKVSQFVSDTVVPALLNFDDLDQRQQQDVSHRLQELQDQSDAADKLNVAEQDSFQLVTKQIDLPPRPSIPRGPCLSEEHWKKRYLTADGRVEHVHELRASIFRGGISRSIRKDVWKFILGYSDYNSTNAQRAEFRKKKVDEYYRMKLQWKSVSEDQEERWMGFRDRKAIVEKDVARTDRNHPFFQGDDNAHVQLLFDILMTYCMYNFDLGYVQGMSDLLSPIIVVLENEVDAFWCFVGFMEKVSANFEMDQAHIKRQLMQLRDVLMVVNPAFLNYLEVHDSDNMFFCFRWILILFKREFSIDDSMYLWEVLWTEMPCRNFHLLICMAILVGEENMIRENKFGFTEILKHINELSMRLNIEDILKDAEAIYHQLAVVQDVLPPHICELFGFGTPTSDTLPPITVSTSSQSLDAISEHTKKGSVTTSKTMDGLSAESQGSPAVNGHTKDSTTRNLSEEPSPIDFSMGTTQSNLSEDGHNSSSSIEVLPEDPSMIRSE